MRFALTNAPNCVYAPDNNINVLKTCPLPYGSMNSMVKGYMLQGRHSGAIL
ncbi:hypothetical protein CES86_2354 [Brucella lupini]|uniref:Uncharacterized protein n=1 Tax=Brucella lupini TaxID=255457 RepID=A0A256GS88_9HYPH|nr:hypothetical protein CES86_2354 [Brucella lupini]